VSKKRRVDPHKDREQKKYATPIPSREFILEILEDAGKPLLKTDLISKLGVRDADEEALGYRLKAMLRDGQLMQDRRRRYCLVTKIHLEKGTVQGHPDGFGFFIPDTEGDDWVISPKEMRGVMHGDRVLAYQVGTDKRGRKDAKIREVIEHANPRVAGRFYTEHGVGFVIPDNKRLTHDILVPLEGSLNASNGQLVLVEIIAYPSKRNQAIGKIIEVVGEHKAPGMETEMAIRAHGIPYEFSKEVLQESANIPSVVLDYELKGRKDLRHLAFVTIDGEDARDFDDAVYCESKPKGGFVLYVAIADVSHYVQPNSNLDKESKNRGNSVYFPARVVPMLPESLSNEICSLKPKVDRLCMVAELHVSVVGKVTKSHFYRAVFHSKARLTYAQVGKWLENNQVADEYQHISANIVALNNLYHTLLKARKERGALEFDTTETRIIFDEHQKIKAIVPVVRNDAHRLIEECMLLANVAVAKYLQQAGIAMLYRVHAAPEEDKLTSLRKFLAEFGIILQGGKKPHPKDFQRSLEAARLRTEKHLIETVLLRSLKQAVYSESNDGHFGLAYPAYTHFTSPIRRYPDLLVHRALGHVIDRHPIEDFWYTIEEMSHLGKHCSITERRADDATRDVVAWLKCEYMQNKLGQEFSGKIASVTNFGIFVLLDEVYVEGLVHITALKNDYYLFDHDKHRLIGDRSGQTYGLGDPVKILVARVDLDERKIDFVLAED
jgi:ribonuclease R